jgi:hypothetical protein
MTLEIVVTVVVIVLGVAALYVAADRARTLVVYRIDPKSRNRLAVVRGRLPAEVVGEIEDVVKRARLATGTIIVRKEDGMVTVRTRGIDDANAVQQLRNAVGRFPKARLRA